MFALGIKAVLFDLGNTLVNQLWIPETVYHRILTSFKINRSIEEIREETKNVSTYMSLKYMYGYPCQVE